MNHKCNFKPWIVLLFPLFIASCTRSETRLGPEPQIEHPYYIFDTPKVTTLSLTRQFPGEEAWTVKLTKRDGRWKINAAPRPLVDSFADDSFINHLLDTLKTFSPQEVAPRGDLTSYGLSPPRAIIRWGDESEKKDLALQLGDETKNDYRFALFSPDTTVMIAQGATLQMLHHIKDWEYLRRKTWLMGDVDDVDAIELQSTSEKNETLERVGTGWEITLPGSQKQNLSSTVSPLLENLIHQRIKRFIDSPEEITLLKNLTQNLKPFQIQLVNRRNERQKLELYETSRGTMGRNSFRENGWFELYPDAAGIFKDLTHAVSMPRKSVTK